MATYSRLPGPDEIVARMTQARVDFTPSPSTVFEPRPSALLGAEEDKKAALEGCRRGYSDAIAAVVKKEAECVQKAKSEGSMFGDDKCKQEADKGYEAADDAYARCKQRYGG